jgi:hypothetical protein
MTKLCPPKPKSPLLLYVSASNSAVSAVLVQEKEEEGKLKQIPVYFASEALSGSKIFYSELEKIAYAVIMAARKLRHYFEGHRIRVINNQSLNDLFANREASTRIIKWGTELSEYVEVERANGMILEGLKPRIFDRLNKSGRKWLQELPAVVWSIRTTPSRATGFTPFFLVHGAEAILPTDLEYGSPRVRGYDEDANQRAREDSLDQFNEARTVALMHSAKSIKVERQLGFP